MVINPHYHLVLHFPAFLMSQLSIVISAELCQSDIRIIDSFCPYGTLNKKDSCITNWFKCDMYYGIYETQITVET